jgi:antibiotic biosynthesis monooxygenase (ABM) superfamily enzyme
LEIRICRASAVIVQKLSPSAADWFLDWQKRVTVQVQGFRGYTGTDVYPPDAARSEWVSVLHFADEPAMQTWLDSRERALLLKELSGHGGEFQMEKLTGGFASWFTRHGPAQKPPPGWKMVFAVVLALYPTVMLWQILVGPLISPLGLAISMLVGNLVSVSILQWVAMPSLTRGLSPWLNAEPTKGKAITLLGAIVIVLLWTAMAAIFYLKTG